MGERMIKTWFPDVSPEQLVRMAKRHVYALECDRGDFGLSDAPVERLVVNYLRHQCTDYDTDQTQERHRAANEAIAARYPWLAAECERQIRLRAERDAELASLVEFFEIDEERRRAERQAIVAASRDAAKKLRVGQVVSYRSRGRVYAATITRIGRTRVTLTYRLRTGGERTAVVHASLVSPVDD